MHYSLYLLWCHIAIEILVNMGSGNGLLPAGAKPLPEPLLTNHQQGLVSYLSLWSLIWFWKSLIYKHQSITAELSLIRSRPNQIAGPAPKSGPARKSESRGPENGVSRWRRPNSDIYSQNHHFGLVYDMIYQFLGMEAKNHKFGMFCQQCHPSMASDDADIRPRNASRIHTWHLFTS